MKKIVTVMVFGTFDIFHKGHEIFLKQARGYGNYLIAVMARNKTVLQVKGELPRNNEKIRLKAIKESGLINEVILGNLTDKYAVIKKYHPDIICLGYDQQVFTDQLEAKLKKYNLQDTEIIRLKAYYPKKYKSSKFRKIENF